MSSRIYSTHRWRVLQRDFKARCKAANIRCALCGHSIDYNAPGRSALAFELDHIVPVSIRPDLAFAPHNWQASHKSCNAAAGDKKAAPMVGDWVAANW